MDQAQFSISRRRLLKGVGGTAGLAAAGALHAPFVMAQPAKLKIGLMLPYTGTFASVGISIDNAFRLYVAEKGGKLGGRELEYVVLDDESDPAKAADNAGRLVPRATVEVLVG